MNTQPPRWASKFLRWYCKHSLLEEIEGDAVELYAQRMKHSGKAKADIGFVFDVIRFFKRSNIKRIEGLYPKGSIMSMLNLNFKIAVRNARKEKFYASLNIAGMALGITVGILLILLLQNDLTYDKHYDYNHIYRLSSKFSLSGIDSKISTSAPELGPILADQIPEIRAVIPIEHIGRALVKRLDQGGEEGSYLEKIIQTDSNYFKGFDHEFIAGDRLTCVKSPQSVVLTESLATKYFGDNDALNQVLVVDDAQWTVTAVIKDLKENSHLKFEMLLSGLSNQREWTKGKDGPISEGFWNPVVYLYLLMPDNYDVESFYSKWPAIYKAHFDEVGKQVSGANVPVLERLDRIHLYSDFDDDESRGDLEGLYAFTAVGLLIFVLACINYMNLATAKAQNRSKEIVMRKIAGSGRRGLIISFLFESMFYSAISFVLAIGIVSLILNYTSISSLIGRNLKLDLFNDTVQQWSSIGIFIGIGLLSGTYPAFFLARTSSIHVLQRSGQNQWRGYSLRRVLVTAQLAITLLVVTCTLLVNDQIEFMQNKSLGFAKENMLVIQIKDTIVKALVPTIKAELLKNPHVKAATTAADALGSDINTGVLWGETDAGWKQAGNISVIFTDENYLKVMNMQLLTGRDFQPGPTADLEGAYIANEAAVKAMDLGANPLGKGVKFYHGELQGKVIGVVKDFNFESLHNKVDPMFIVKANWFRGFLHLRIDNVNMSETIEFVKNTFAAHDPKHPFEYFFLDERLRERYESDVIQKRLMSYLSFTCIGISLLGLIGMSAFTTIQRTKEIGIRKVLGASIPQIIVLLSKSTVALVLIAAILIGPVSVWVVKLWMVNFAYQTELNYFLYALVVLLTIGVVLMTITFQSLKVTLANPVESLRHE